MPYTYIVSVPAEPTPYLWRLGVGVDSAGARVTAAQRLLAHLRITRPVGSASLRLSVSSWSGESRPDEVLLQYSASPAEDCWVLDWLSDFLVPFKIEVGP